MMTDAISSFGPLVPLPKSSHAPKTGITQLGAPVQAEVEPTAPITIGAPVTPAPGKSAPVTKLGAPLTPDQQTALKRLHQATTQLEGVFLQMVMHEMSKSVPKDSLTGKQSSAEETFSGMLDDERAKAIAQSGTLGIAKVLDEQLRNSVLSDAKHESKIDVDKEVER